MDLKNLFKPKATSSAAAGSKKSFDINIYFKAVGNFSENFFKNQIPYFFKNLGPVLKKFPDWVGKLPNDEKAAYGVFVLGNVLVLVSIVLFIF